VLLSGWFEWAMRSADTPTSTLSHSFGPYQSVKAPVSRR
jgi:hypothetical protein